MSQQFPAEGDSRMEGDRGKEVQWCWTITWGLSFWDGGKQEADAWMIHRQKSELCVPKDLGVDCYNYVMLVCVSA